MALYGSKNATSSDGYLRVIEPPYLGVPNLSHQFPAVVVVVVVGAVVVGAVVVGAVVVGVVVACVVVVFVVVVVVVVVVLGSGFD